MQAILTKRTVPYKQPGLRIKGGIISGVRYESEQFEIKDHAPLQTLELSTSALKHARPGLP
jgi:hypothetical protein